MNEELRNPTSEELRALRARLASVTEAQIPFQTEDMTALWRFSERYRDFVAQGNEPTLFFAPVYEKSIRALRAECDAAARRKDAADHYLADIKRICSSAIGILTNALPDARVGAWSFRVPKETEEKLVAAALRVNRGFDGIGPVPREILETLPPLSAARREAQLLFAASVLLSSTESTDYSEWRRVLSEYDERMKDLSDAISSVGALALRISGEVIPELRAELLSEITYTEDGSPRLRDAGSVGRLRQLSQSVGMKLDRLLD